MRKAELSPLFCKQERRANGPTLLFVMQNYMAYNLEKGFCSGHHHRCARRSALYRTAGHAGNDLLLEERVPQNTGHNRNNNRRIHRYIIRCKLVGKVTDADLDRFILRG